MSNQAMREEWGFLDERAALEALRSQSMMGVPLNESGAINLCHAYQVARFAAIAAHEREKAGAQEPLFWYRPRSDGLYEGPIHDAQIEQVRKESGGWVPLWAGCSEHPPSGAQSLRETVEKIARIAHCGGLVGMSEHDALVAIRKESLHFWRTVETVEQARAALRQQGENK